MAGSGHFFTDSDGEKYIWNHYTIASSDQLGIFEDEPAQIIDHPVKGQGQVTDFVLCLYRRLHRQVSIFHLAHQLYDGGERG